MINRAKLRLGKRYRYFESIIPRRSFAQAILKSDFGHFTVSSIALNITTLIAYTIALKWIEPKAMGIWQTLVIIQSYLNILRFGVLNGMNREYPYLLGRGDIEEAQRAVATAQAYTLVCSFFCLLIFFVGLGRLWVWGWSWRVGLIASGIVTATTSFQTYILATYRSKREFRRLANIQYVQAMIEATLPLFAYFGGYVGFCLHITISTLAILCITFLNRPVRVAPKFHWSSLRYLLRTGLPLFAANYLMIFANGFDRIILLKRSSIEDVGLYAPSVAVLTAMSIIPASISTYLYPRMSFRFGKTNDNQQLRGLSFGAILATLIVGLPLAITGWLMSPRFVSTFFPDYLPGLGAMRISWLTGLALGLAAGTTLLGSLKAWKLLYLYMGVVVSTKWLFPWFISKKYAPLEGVALGGLIAAIFAGIAGIWVTHRSTMRINGMPEALR